MAISLPNADVLGAFRVIAKEGTKPLMWVVWQTDFNVIDPEIIGLFYLLDDALTFAAYWMSELDGSSDFQFTVVEYRDDVQITI